MRELAIWAGRPESLATPFPNPITETIDQTMRRRLINHTPSLTTMVEQLCIAANHECHRARGRGRRAPANLPCQAHPRLLSRQEHRFLVVPCGTLSGNLIASEFFGHVKGAFTGADGMKVGKFAAAGKGSILLDEIDTLGLDHQANLLRGDPKRASSSR